MTKFHKSIDKIKLLLQMIAAELNTADRKPEYYITSLTGWIVLDINSVYFLSTGPEDSRPLLLHPRQIQKDWQIAEGWISIIKRRTGISPNVVAKCRSCNSGGQSNLNH